MLKGMQVVIKTLGTFVYGIEEGAEVADKE